MEPPDPDLLATHLAIAKTLAVCGMGAKVDHCLYQYDLDDERDGPTESAPRDCADMISAGALAASPSDISNCAHIVSRKHTP